MPSDRPERDGYVLLCLDAVLAAVTALAASLLPEECGVHFRGT